MPYAAKRKRFTPRTSRFRPMAMAGPGSSSASSTSVTRSYSNIIAVPFLATETFREVPITITDLLSTDQLNQVTGFGSFKLNFVAVEVQLLTSAEALHSICTPEGSTSPATLPVAVQTVSNTVTYSGFKLLSSNITPRVIFKPIQILDKGYQQTPAGVTHRFGTITLNALGLTAANTITIRVKVGLTLKLTG